MYNVLHTNALGKKSVTNVFVIVEVHICVFQNNVVSAKYTL